MPWTPGISGNPRGGSALRDSFSQRFLADMHAEWRRSGADVLKSLAAFQPEKFAALAARIVPQELDVSVSDLNEKYNASLRGLSERRLRVSLPTESEEDLAAEVLDDPEAMRLLE